MKKALFISVSLMVALTVCSCFGPKPYEGTFKGTAVEVVTTKDVITVEFLGAAKIIFDINKVEKADDEQGRFYLLYFGDDNKLMAKIYDDKLIYKDTRSKLLNYTLKRVDR